MPRRLQKPSPQKRHGLAGCIAILFAMLLQASALSAQKPILIGLDADLSAGAARGGEAIRRGIVLAIEEINKSGGVLGRPLKLVAKDHRGNPARGIDNMNDFARMRDLVAVVGGIHTPVAITEIDTIHRHKLIYLSPWAAGTQLVDNGHRPNYVFRVSVRDEHAGGFLIGKALERGFRRPGLLLWRTAWGRSNKTAMERALSRAGISHTPLEWFNSGAHDFSHHIAALISKGADAVMLVANPTDGLQFVRAMAAQAPEDRLPVISHWGITGGSIYEQAPAAIGAIDLTFLQTFSFHQPPFANRAKKLLRSYCMRFEHCASARDVFSPVGTAHAYDLVHILRLAIEKAGTIDRPKVRSALETVRRYNGIMRNYNPPFTPKRHDALNTKDFRLSRFDHEGAIVPVGAP